MLVYTWYLPTFSTVRRKDIQAKDSYVFALGDAFSSQRLTRYIRAQFLVNVSTCAIHDFEIAAQHLKYSASKSAGTILLQQVAKGFSADDMQVVSFHPRAIFTSAAKDAGYSETTMKWDDGKCYL
jgi:NAD(P)-dependent dehydrogenase (short-subunit alcohol dehydrogenase family)